MAPSIAERALATTRLTARFSTLAAEVNQTSLADDAAGWAGDLDLADLRIGTDYVADTHTLAYLALAEYYALVRIHSLIATRVDTQGYAVDGDRQSIFANVHDLLQEQERICAAYGYPVTGEDTGEIGVIPEPDADTLQGGLFLDTLILGDVAGWNEWG